MEQTICGDREGGVGDSGVGGGAVKKVCGQCGCNLAGHTRYRDGRGAYWCVACHRRAERAVECEDCHKMIALQKVDRYGGRTLCGACARERAQDKSRPHREHYRQIYDQLERRRALHLAGAVGMLIVSLTVLIWMRVL